MSSAALTEVNAVLDALASGTMPSEPMVVALSDLGRSEAAVVASRWTSLPILPRTAAMTVAAALTHSRVDLDYLRLASVVLSQDTPIAQRAALAALEGRGGSEIAARVADVLAAAEDDQLLAAAAEAAAPYMLQLELGELDEEEGERLAIALRDLAHDSPSTEVQAHAIRSAGYLSREWVEEFVRDAYYSEDQVLRIAAIDAMGNSANIDWFEYLEETITAEDPAFRVAVANAFAAIGDEAAVDLVAELLVDEEHEVVAAAMAALAEIGGEEAVDHLENFRRRVPEELEGQLNEATSLARSEFEAMSPPSTEDDDE